MADGPSGRDILVAVSLGLAAGARVGEYRGQMQVCQELAGRKKYRSWTGRDLMRLNLKGEDFDWVLWVEEHDHFKLIRMAIPADNTEVLRD